MSQYQGINSRFSNDDIWIHDYPEMHLDVNLLYDFMIRPFWSASGRSGTPEDVF